MAEYIEREALLAFPIRIDHYDKENGNLDFVLGIESVMEYAEHMPAADVVSLPVVRQIQWERDIAMQQLEEHGIPFCGKADVVPVVRCKDCKQNLGIQGDFIECGYWLDIVKPNGFCSYGERRESDG